MRRPLIVRASLVAITLSVSGVGVYAARAKTPKERFAAFYESVPTGSSVWRLEREYRFPRPRPADSIDLAVIYNALYTRWPDTGGVGDALTFRNRADWLRFMLSGPVEWWVWEDPNNSDRWIAVAQWICGTGCESIIYKLRCGF